jgi:uncharacterized protein (UPF0548 family)
VRDEWREVTRRVVIGLSIWLIWAVSVRPGWAETALLFSPLVLVPLGLLVVLGSAPSLRRPQNVALLAAAFGAALSFAPQAGWLAGLLSVPWLGACCVIGIVGLGRLLSRRSAVPAIAADFGLLYLVVGAGWLTLSRLGANPLGFSDTIVLLTAVHFHYAGFVLPIVAGVVASRMNVSWAIPAAVVIGVPFTAVGITAGGTLEWLAATFMAASGLATAWILGSHSRRGVMSWARALLRIAALSLTVGMAFAVAWAWSTRFGWRFLDVAWMARTHGSINAFGFAVPAMVALAAQTISDQTRSVHTAQFQGFQSVLHLLLRRPATVNNELHRLRLKATDDVPTSRVGLIHDATVEGYQREEWTIDLPHGFESGCDAVRHWASHKKAGVTVVPASVPLAVGETVSLCIPLSIAQVVVCSVTATCRVVETIDEADRFGFTYATLPHHPEDGEETFLVERRADGTATYTVRVVWRAGVFASRIAPPITRLLQRRATLAYLEGVREWRTASSTGT